MASRRFQTGLKLQLVLLISSVSLSSAIVQLQTVNYSRIDKSTLRDRRYSELNDELTRLKNSPEEFDSKIQHNDIVLGGDHLEPNLQAQDEEDLSSNDTKRSINIDVEKLVRSQVDFGTSDWVSLISTNGQTDAPFAQNALNQSSLHPHPNHKYKPDPSLTGWLASSHSNQQLGDLGGAGASENLKLSELRPHAEAASGTSKPHPIEYIYKLRGSSTSSQSNSNGKQLSHGASKEANNQTVQLFRRLNKLSPEKNLSISDSWAKFANFNDQQQRKSSQIGQDTNQSINLSGQSSINSSGFVDLPPLSPSASLDPPETNGVLMIGENDSQTNIRHEGSAYKSPSRYPSGRLLNQTRDLHQYSAFSDPIPTDFSPTKPAPKYIVRIGSPERIDTTSNQTSSNNLDSKESSQSSRQMSDLNGSLSARLNQNRYKGKVSPTTSPSGPSTTTLATSSSSIHPMTLEIKSRSRPASGPKFHYSRNRASSNERTSSEPIKGPLQRQQVRSSSIATSSTTSYPTTFVPMTTTLSTSIPQNLSSFEARLMAALASKPETMLASSLNGLPAIPTRHHHLHSHIHSIKPPAGSLRSMKPMPSYDVLMTATATAAAAAAAAAAASGTRSTLLPAGVNQLGSSVTRQKHLTRPNRLPYIRIPVISKEDIDEEREASGMKVKRRQPGSRRPYTIPIGGTLATARSKPSNGFQRPINSKSKPSAWQSIVELTNRLKQFSLQTKSLSSASLDPKGMASKKQVQLVDPSHWLDQLAYSSRAPYDYELPSENYFSLVNAPTIEDLNPHLVHLDAFKDFRASLNPQYSLDGYKQQLSIDEIANSHWQPANNKFLTHQPSVMATESLNSVAPLTQSQGSIVTNHTNLSQMPDVSDAELDGIAFAPLGGNSNVLYPILLRPNKQPITMRHQQSQSSPLSMFESPDWDSFEGLIQHDEEADELEHDQLPTSQQHDQHQQHQQANQHQQEQQHQQRPRDTSSRPASELKTPQLEILRPMGQDGGVGFRPVVQLPPGRNVLLHSYERQVSQQPSGSIAGSQLKVPPMDYALSHYIGEQTTGMGQQSALASIQRAPSGSIGMDAAKQQVQSNYELLKHHESLVHEHLNQLKSGDATVSAQANHWQPDALIIPLAPVQLAQESQQAQLQLDYGRTRGPMGPSELTVAETDVSDLVKHHLAQHLLRSPQRPTRHLRQQLQQHVQHATGGRDMTTSDSVRLDAVVPGKLHKLLKYWPVLAIFPVVAAIGIAVQLVIAAPVMLFALSTLLMSRLAMLVMGPLEMRDDLQQRQVHDDKRRRLNELANLSSDLLSSLGSNFGAETSQFKEDPFRLHPNQSAGNSTITAKKTTLSRINETKIAAGNQQPLRRSRMRRRKRQVNVYVGRSLIDCND